MRLRRNNFLSPTILKGIPLPKPLERVKKHNVNESVWAPFLRRLEPGDCFEIEYHQLGGLKSAAHKRDIPIVYRSVFNNRPSVKVRVWRAS